MTAPALTYPRTNSASLLLPATAPGPGQALWGEAPRRQPIAPLILMATVLLLIAAPVALAGDGGSRNPISSMKQIAEATYELTGLMQQSNDTLAKIDTNSKRLSQVQQDMAGISEASTGMADQTTELASTLEGVGESTTQQRAKLTSVSGKLTKTVAGMKQTRTDVTRSLDATTGIATDFRTINSSITGIRTSLTGTITAMTASAPLTREFADNRTRKSVTGGDTRKFGIPNFAPNNRVMSVVLKMIPTMQVGGPLAARKDGQVASNPIIGMSLSKQVPDGTNVLALIRPYDGTYGLPPSNFFVQHPVNGF